MKEKILSLLLLLGCSLSFAETVPQVPCREASCNSKLSTSCCLNSNLHPFALLAVGADFIRTGESKSITLLPPFSNYYTNHSSYPGSASLGIGGGIEGIYSERFFWQLGASGMFNATVTRWGEVWQMGLPEFNNFQYRYNIQSSRVVAIGKLLSTIYKHYHPYLSGELGAAFNASRSYQETPLIEEAVLIAPFSNHRQSSVAWGIGIGIDWDLNPIARLGLGYQFVNLGKARLGLSPAQTTQEHLSISNLYDHQLRVQLTALI